MQVGLQLRLKPQLSLTPQLQQAIGLMQLSTMALRSEIQSFAESNPLLEVDYIESEEATSDQVLLNPSSNSHANTITQGAEYASFYSSHTGDYWEDEFRNRLADEGLHEKLISQLNQSVLSSEEEIIGLAIIDAINAAGYLQESCAEIAETLRAQGFLIDQNDVEMNLQRIQLFEPNGVGARNLSECLILQLNEYPEADSIVILAKKVAGQYLDYLQNGQHKKLLKQTGASQQDCSLAIKLLQSLNPRPGAQYSVAAQNYSVPDVMVVKTGNDWGVVLNDALLPQFRVNARYLTQLASSKDSVNNDYRRERLKEVKGFIKGIEIRHQTLMVVSQKIIAHQRNFLLHGVVAMQPLTLQQIADELGLHESTVSRITTQKTMLTPHGLFELKYFFSSQLRTENGIVTSSTAIRALIKQLISQEDRLKPLSDNAVSKLLKSNGLLVARRTVTKYREGLGIPPSVDRKMGYY